jgi:hypothetical protein
VYLIYVENTSPQGGGGPGNVIRGNKYMKKGRKKGREKCGRRRKTRKLKLKRQKKANRVHEE